VTLCERAVSDVCNCVPTKREQKVFCEITILASYCWTDSATKHDRNSGSHDAEIRQLEWMQKIGRRHL
jgi:hypothetical protein